ncbi:MAG: ribonuclease P protein component [Pseudomonadota bacterium]|nr:ribonuclease P protein component [Pseudomonadota bacterium]
MPNLNTTCAFTRAQRLFSAEEFKKVFEKPYKSADGYFTVLATANQLPQARLGLAIARKYVKPATVRNRIKRLVRESFRHHQQSLRGLDCVVLAKSRIVQVDNAELFSALSRHWQKLARARQNDSP